MGLDLASAIQYVKDNLTLLAFLAVVVSGIVALVVTKTRGNQTNNLDLKEVSGDNLTINQNNSSTSGNRREKDNG